MTNASRTSTARATPATPQLLQTVAYALLIIAFTHAIFVLLLGLNQPLLDRHQFRQTQNALTAYWILKGGPWFAYESPVLGAPWAIPFEFPIYQLLTAGLSSLSVPLEISGRIIGYSSFLGSLWPLWILARELNIGRPTYLATAILFLTCPLYLYWSRTFMTETCALFLALVWLALLVRYLNRRDWRVAIGALVSGCLADDVSGLCTDRLRCHRHLDRTWLVRRRAERTAATPRRRHCNCGRDASRGWLRLDCIC